MDGFGIPGWSAIRLSRSSLEHLGEGKFLHENAWPEPRRSHRHVISACCKTSSGGAGELGFLSATARLVRAAAARKSTRGTGRCRLHSHAVTIIHVPYHQDERLPASDLSLPESEQVFTVDAELGSGDFWTRLGTLYQWVAEAVAEAVRTGSSPRVVSGDCLVSSGVLAGLQRAGVPASIVWFDAHGDVHTSQTSTSGYPGGMALRLLLGAEPERLAHRLGLEALGEEHAVLVDARDLDPAEVDYLAVAGPRRLPVDDIGPGALPPGPIVLHIDVDVVDSTELPGMRFPAGPGPSSRSVLAAAQRIMAAGRVVAIDIACPWHSDEGTDTRTRSRLLSELLSL